MHDLERTWTWDSYQKLFEGRLKSSDDFITLKKYLLFYTNTHELPIKSSIDNKTHVGGVIKIVNNSRLIEQNILFEPWGKLPRKITNIKFHRQCSRWERCPARGLQWKTFRFHGIEETIIGIRCRKRHGCLNRKKHRNEKPFRRIKYKRYNIFYRFIRCWLNATFLFVYLDPENKKYLYSSIGLFRQRSENRLEVRYTNGKSRKKRRNKKNWTNKSRKWIKTLRLLSDGTKSCDF